MLGWGSSYGPIGEACRRARRKGIKVAHAHLRHLSPFPANLGDVLRRYPKVVAPEMNLGSWRCCCAAATWSISNR